MIQMGVESLMTMRRRPQEMMRRAMIGARRMMAEERRESRRRGEEPRLTGSCFSQCTLVSALRCIMTFANK